MSDSSLLVSSWGWVGGFLLRTLPQGLQRVLLSLLLVTLEVFRSPGVCTSASLVKWVGLQPFPSFSGLLLLRLLAGVVGVLHPV